MLTVGREFGLGYVAHAEVTMQELAEMVALLMAENEEAKEAMDA